MAITMNTATTTPIGNQILSEFTTQTTAAGSAVSDAINAASLNAGDPTNMIKMQVALANYNIALQVQSSVIKSIEETAKSITQKL